MTGTPASAISFFAASFSPIAVMLAGAGPTQINPASITACAIGNVDPDDAVSRIWPYLGALLAGTIIVAGFPWLSIGFL